ncbi:MAG: hypothetical protein COB53_02355 [Elusimicrobia bacterium]|nr:MAG: hypothetical protein COB53_02355 [Elusimicrobiota bacterium]
MNDPYHAVGLHRNPFRIDPDPGVVESLFLSRASPKVPAPKGRRFLQVMGPRGAGKTTLLLHWRRTVSGPYRYVPPSLERWLPLPIAPLVYWDEADRVPAELFYPALAASRLFESTVVVGTHEDLGAAAARFGFTVETFEIPVIRPEEVMRWAEVRIRADSMEPGSPGLVLEYEEACRVARDADRSWRRVGGHLHRWAAGIVNRSTTSYT